ncbi:MAG: hypothetical protein JWQ08_313 [Deinococcus sp.]|nr:hypothetical protein [Deinococcus sp.]
MGLSSNWALTGPTDHANTVGGKNNAVTGLKSHLLQGVHLFATDYGWGADLEMGAVGL